MLDRRGIRGFFQNSMVRSFFSTIIPESTLALASDGDAAMIPESIPEMKISNIRFGDAAATEELPDPPMLGRVTHPAVHRVWSFIVTFAAVPR